MGWANEKQATGAKKMARLIDWDVKNLRQMDCRPRARQMDYLRNSTLFRIFHSRTHTLRSPKYALKITYLVSPSLPSHFLCLLQLFVGCARCVLFCFIFFGVCFFALARFVLRFKLNYKKYINITHLIRFFVTSSTGEWQLTYDTYTPSPHFIQRKISRR